MNEPGRPFPRPAIYTGGEEERFGTFSIGQKGQAHFDPTHLAYLIFVPDSDPEEAKYVYPENLRLL
jgi:hypothetical protein